MGTKYWKNGPWPYLSDAAGGHVYDGIYVAADSGNDANSGTNQEPVKTLQAAWDLSSDNDIIVLSEAGSYGGLAVTAVNKKLNIKIVDSTSTKTSKITNTIDIDDGVYGVGDQFISLFGVEFLLDIADSELFDFGNNDVLVDLYDTRISAYLGTQSLISAGTVRLYLEKGFIVVKQWGAGTVSNLIGYDGSIVSDNGVTCSFAVFTDFNIETSLAVSAASLTSAGVTYLARSKVFATGYVPGAIVTTGLFSSTESIWNTQYSTYGSLELFGIHDFSDNAADIRANLTTEPGALGATAMDSSGMLVHDGSIWRPFDISIANVALDPTGIIDRTTSEIIFTDGGTGSITIQPLAPATEFDVYINGVTHTYNSAQTTVLDGAEGIHWAYFDDTGTLQSVASAEPDFSNALVATSHWDATSSVFTKRADERHGIMQWITHKYLHEVIGTKVSGFTLSRLATGTGAADNDAKILLGNGVIADEDLVYNITDGFPQDLSPIAQIPIIYRDGATGVYRKLAADDYPLITASKAGSGARAHYNEFTGGVWTFSEVQDNRYMCMFLIGDNDLSEPIYAIPSQTDGRLDDMQELLFSDLNLPTNILPERVLMYKLIIRTRNSYGNTPKAYIAGVTDYRKSGITNATAITATDHNTLNNRDVLGSHPSRAVANSYVTVSDTDHVVASDENGIVYDTLTAARAIALPDAAAFPGRRIMVKDLSGNSGTHNLTVTPSIGTIDGSATFVISTGLASFHFVSYNDNWIVE